MKVSELTGAKLDYWVAMALGAKSHIELVAGKEMCWSAHEAFETVPFRPSTQWSDGGPIIQSEDICTAGNRASYSLDALYHGDTPPAVYDGATKLQAAMRAFVANKYGEEVPDAA